MSNTTYTARGTFTTVRTARVEICIPAQIPDKPTSTTLYNFSKRTSSGIINAVFCHFNNDSQQPIEHSDFDYVMDFEIDKLNRYAEAAEFDESQPETLFIFYHNTDCSATDKAFFFSDLENILENVRNNGNQSGDAEGSTSKTSSSNSGPRKVGLSLVIK
ncbi:hypothetical protein FLAN108750_05345 [Flavobacterium antarcticum]|uniref:hypothetical protein n=1 Tax=Flavobacterium antarcticum TaxID=271155 RepID=UPI0003B6E5A8|nr:hypothetical protein [Flavobacterium antarcticum]